MRDPLEPRRPRGSAEGGEPVALPDLAGLDPIGDIQFAQQVGHVDARGLLADEECFGDLTVGPTRRQLGKDFDFALSQSQVTCEQCLIRRFAVVERCERCELDAGSLGEILDLGPQRESAELDDLTPSLVEDGAGSASSSPALQQSFGRRAARHHRQGYMPPWRSEPHRAGLSHTSH
jgi:hypothetical protein